MLHACTIELGSVVQWILLSAVSVISYWVVLGIVPNSAHLDCTAMAMHVDCTREDLVQKKLFKPYDSLTISYIKILLGEQVGIRDTRTVISGLLRNYSGIPE